MADEDKPSTQINIKQTASKIEAGGEQNALKVGEVTRRTTITIEPSTIGALYSLRPPPAEFVGRTREVEQLLDQKSRGATITGMDGVGKTALALHVADQLAKNYPDAQIFLDLQATSDKPLSPVEAMSRVIYAINPTADCIRCLKPESPTITAARFTTNAGCSCLTMWRMPRRSQT